jgi:hypothetical protein
MVRVSSAAASASAAICGAKLILREKIAGIG